MNTRTEHLLIVTQYIAKSFDLDYAQKYRELLSSTKPIEKAKPSQFEKLLNSAMPFYRNYNWLYLIVVPVAAVVSFLASSLLTFYNEFGIFLTLSVVGLIFGYLILDCEKRKNQLLVLTKKSLSLLTKFMHGLI